MDWLFFFLHSVYYLLFLLLLFVFLYLRFLVVPIQSVDLLVLYGVFSDIVALVSDSLLLLHFEILIVHDLSEVGVVKVPEHFSWDNSFLF